ncbi:hypothetical protein ACIPYS_09125 [Kitasatospora sp. NPDC089913]|uniref:hypothetical protein n=1 Tax=Streptomycetaceae TaxID=2062 RepID=UPI00087BA738|nr:hypothetical protein [Streptomyces sp. TLI_053]SDS65952.1 hypothetical protein SAMN05216371_0361 [Streptomyces sp. TLI_053]
MGIEIELHSARLALIDWDTSRASLLHGSYEHGEALGEVLAGLAVNHPGKLRTVDPYGDTQFDEQDARAALGEIAGLRKQCADAAQEAAVRDLAMLLESCATTPGSHLWFMGD